MKNNIKSKYHITFYYSSHQFNFFSPTAANAARSLSGVSVSIVLFLALPRRVFSFLGAASGYGRISSGGFGVDVSVEVDGCGPAACQGVTATVGSILSSFASSPGHSPGMSRTGSVSLSVGTDGSSRSSVNTSRFTG